MSDCVLGLDSGNESKMESQMSFFDGQLAPHELCKLRELVTQVKNDNIIFTRSLLTEQALTMSWIQMIAQPEKYERVNNVKLELETVHNGIEMLSNLSDYFVTVALKSKPTTEDEISGQFWLIDALFDPFLSKQVPINQNGAAYLVKVMIPLVYQAPSELLNYMTSPHRPIIEALRYHLYSKSVTQLLIKVLQIQQESNYFEQQKLSILRSLSVQQHPNSFLMSQILDNLRQTFESVLIITNSDEHSRYSQSSKEMQLAKAILAESSILVSIEKVISFGLAISEGLSLYCHYLQFCLHRQTKADNSLSDNSESNIIELKPNPQAITAIQRSLSHTERLIAQDKVPTEFLVWYFKTLYLLLHLNPASTIVLKPFQKSKVHRYLSLMKVRHKCDIINIQIKNLFFQGIKTSNLQNWLLRERSFLNLVLSILLKRQGNKNSQLLSANHFFLICEALEKAAGPLPKHNPDQIPSSLNEPTIESLRLQLRSAVVLWRSAYDKQLCNNPRKDTYTWAEMAGDDNQSDEEVSATKKEVSSPVIIDEVSGTHAPPTWHFDSSVCGTVDLSLEGDDLSSSYLGQDNHHIISNSVDIPLESEKDLSNSGEGINSSILPKDEKQGDISILPKDEKQGDNSISGNAFLDGL